MSLRCATKSVVLTVALLAGCALFQTAQPQDPPRAQEPDAVTPVPKQEPAPALPASGREPSVAPAQSGNVSGETSGEKEGPAAAPPATPAPASPVVETPARKPAAAELGAPTAKPVAKQEPPTAKAAPKPEPEPSAAKAVPKPEKSAPAKPAAPPTLDLASLEKRLKETSAIGVFTKLTLKNQVDDLLGQFRAYYQGKLKTTLTDLRQPYDLLILKVMTLLQDGDPSLATAVRESREAIWGILSDPVRFSKIQT